MGAIYASAHFTIIAAAGDDPLYGLPGVSRPVIQGLRFDSQDLKRTLIHDSRWASRAWTFQESFLSQRRLLFTEAGLVFLCNTEVKSAIFNNFKWFFTRNTQTALKDFAFQDSDYSLEGMFDILRHYSSRNLSFQSDALDAVVGVLNAFSIKNESLFHMWGVPCQISGQNAVIALSWSYENSADIKTEVRRSEFPSWSPLGWRTKGIRFDRPEWQFRQHPDFHVRIKHDDRLVDLQAGQTCLSAFASQCLVVTAHSVLSKQRKLTMIINHDHTEYRQRENYFTVEFDNIVPPQGARVFLRASWLVKGFEEETSTEFLCVFRLGTGSGGLVLKNCGQVHERVGSFSLVQGVKRILEEVVEFPKAEHRTILLR